MDNYPQSNLYLVTSVFKDQLPGSRTHEGITVAEASASAALTEFVRVWPHRIPLTVTKVSVNQTMPIHIVKVTKNITTYSV